MPLPTSLPPPHGGPRVPLWGTVLVALIAAAAGVLIYHTVSGNPRSQLSGSPAAAATRPAPTSRPSSTLPPATPTPAPSPSVTPGTVVISLAAVTEPCWAELTTAAGATVYQGILAVGSTMNWTETQAVTLTLGNPAAITLTVDGKPRTGLGVNPVTLSLAPGQ